MKKIFLISIVFMFITSFVIAEELVGKKVSLPFNVYTDQNATDNHFAPSGWMGDHGAIKMDANCEEEPHSGTTCIKFIYTAEMPQGSGWAGVYWQNPPNNWGSIKGGFDLTGAKVVKFWARGQKGTEKLEFKIGGISGEYADSDTVTTGFVTLTNFWKEYTIDLTGANLSYISGGFVWAANRLDNPDGIVFYLDDIRYE